MTWSSMMPPHRRPPNVLPNSARILDRLTGLHPKVIDLSLGRIERLLDRLGRPQDHLPAVVHVAGTNGKGSVIAFLRAMLEAAGLRAHVYTSPHLVRFSERIVVAGREIADRDLALLLEECEAVNDGAPITFFEITTAAAFLAFARTPADVALLETGLGGRLDATNVVETPALTAITSLSLDHQGFLGDTIEAIAFEKAGILKPQVPCLMVAQGVAGAADVVRARAAAVGAPMREEGRDWRCVADGTGLAWSGDAVLRLPHPALPGAHQTANAGLAVACARALAEAGIGAGMIGAQAIGQGIASACWPARLQRLERGLLPALLPDGWELWLDGGHNPGAGGVLGRHLSAWRDRPCYLVVGMLRTKDAALFLAPMVPHVAHAITVAIPGEAASVSADEMAAIAASQGLPSQPAASVTDALALLASRDGAPARVLICGSLYLAGRVLAENVMD